MNIARAVWTRVHPATVDRSASGHEALTGAEASSFNSGSQSVGYFFNILAKNL